MLEAGQPSPPHPQQHQQSYSADPRGSTQMNGSMSGAPSMGGAPTASTIPTNMPTGVPAGPPPSMPRPEGRVYKAIYEYTAADDDEIGFEEGDLIINCEPIDEGWMSGMHKKSGQVGMLPANYVELVL